MAVPEQILVYGGIFLILLIAVAIYVIFEHKRFSKWIEKFMDFLLDVAKSPI